MHYPTRWQSAILDTLKVDGQATITALAERLSVSDETVRRHVKPLVADGILKRVHGGVILTGSQVEPPFSRRMRERTEAKRAIAAAVAEHVTDGMTLLIDSGSTTAFVAECLLQKNDLIVVTNSLEIARTLVGRRGSAVYMAGGLMRADIGAAVGQEVKHFITQFRAELAILSMGAIDADGGFMDFDVDEARIARTMIECSGRVIVAADAAKFTAKASVRVCGADAVDLLVSDRAPPPALSRTLRAGGTEIEIAGARTSKRSFYAATHAKRAQRRNKGQNFRQDKTLKSN